MKRNDRFISMLVLALLASCSTQEEDFAPEGGTVLTAVLEGPDTKVSFDNLLGHLSWDTGDQIAVYLGSAYVQAEVTPSNGHVSVTETSASRRDRFAIYPYADRVDGQTTAENLGVKLPASYDISGIVAGTSSVSADYSPAPMVAVNDPKESTLRFRHVGGLLRMTCNRVPAGTKTIKVTVDQNITGTYTVSNPSSTMPTISTPGTASDNTPSVVFTVSTSGLGGETDGIVLNVPVPCGTYQSVTVETFTSADASGTARTQETAHGRYVIARHYGMKVPFEDLGDFQLSVQDPTDLSWEGGTSTTARVVSYARNGSSTDPVAWEAYEYYQDAACTVPYDGSNAAKRPDWLTASFSGSGTADPAGEQANIAYAGFTSIEASSSAAASTLTDNGFGTGSSSSNYYNLSNPYDMTSNYIKESANCYIVNGPGYYRIPLVMGSSIRDNRTRDDFVWKGRAPGENNVNKTTRFMDYKGNTGDNLNSPYLHISRTGSGATANDYTPSSAYVVWEDVDGLIEVSSNYTVAGTNPIAFTGSGAGGERVYWLQFHVQGTTKGNAVIAVTDNSGVVMWSWHIWVTDFVPRNYPGYATSIQQDIPVTNYTNVVYTMMPMYLGWVPNSTQYTYEPRTVYVKIRQPSGTATAVMAVTQNGGVTTSESWNGRAPYFQWGRKDPFRPGKFYNPNVSTATFGNIDPWPCVGKDNTILTYDGTTDPVAINTAIQHPEVFHGKWTGSGTGALSANLWSAANTKIGNGHGSGDSDALTDTPVVKTIYDPCPAGYCLPASRVFTGFTTTGESQSRDASKLRIKGTWNFGWNFYTDNNRNRTIFFPALGALGAANGDPSGQFGNVWTGLPDGNTSGFYMTFSQYEYNNGNPIYDNYYVNPHQSDGGNARSFGKSVIPVED